jgi:UDP-N-acetylglucosamine acyltransferase
LAIHPTAVVHPGAEIGEDVEIGPYAIVEPGAIVGRGNRIGPHAFVGRGTRIGENNQVYQGAILGCDPQDRKYGGDPTPLEIGDRNVFREYCTVSRGTSPSSPTRIGNDCLFMAASHVGHDCVLADDVILSNSALLAGHIEIESGVRISGNVSVHQFTRIGGLTMIGGHATVTRDIPPYFIAVGQRPCTVYGPNVVGMRRAGIPPERRLSVKVAYRTIYRSGLSIPEAVERLESMADVPEVRHIVDFIRASRRGIEIAGSLRRARLAEIPEPPPVA